MIIHPSIIINYGYRREGRKEMVEVLGLLGDCVGVFAFLGFEG